MRRDPVCIVSRWDPTACGGAGDFRPIRLFPAQPRRRKTDAIAPPVIDLVELGHVLGTDVVKIQEALAVSA